MVKYEVKKRSYSVTRNEANQRHITVLATALHGSWTTQQLVEMLVCAFEGCLSSVPSGLRPGTQNGDAAIALGQGSAVTLRVSTEHKRAGCEHDNRKESPRQQGKKRDLAFPTDGLFSAPLLE